MNVPKMRFREFKNEWKKEKFSQFSYNSGKRNKDNLNLIPYAITNTFGFVPQNEAHNEFGYMKDTDRKAYNIVTKNSFAYNPARINVGSIGYYSDNEDIIVSSLYEVFKTKNYINDKFIWYWLKSDKFPKWINRLQEGSVRQYFYYDKLCETPVYLPSRNEQEKISNTLELLDKKIELQSKKIEDLKLFKKGLSNDLIDCINEYNEFTLEDIGTTYSGLSGKAKEDFENGNSKFISFMSVLKDKIEVDKLPTVKIDSNENQNKVQKNDLFFNTSSETKEEVALCSTINEDIDNLYLNSFCFGYRINNLKLVNNEYLNIMLHCTSYRKLISNLGQGFTRVNISKKELMNLIVKVPSIDVQTKIVDIINKVKNIIDLEVIKLSKLLEFKKGLMQQLFI